MNLYGHKSNLYFIMLHHAFTSNQWQKQKSMHDSKKIDCVRRRTRRAEQNNWKIEKYWPFENNGHKCSAIELSFCVHFKGINIYVIPISFAHMKILRGFSVFVCACAATLLIYSHSQLGNINIFCSDEANADFPHVWPDVPAGVASNEMNHFCFLLHKPGL